MDLRGATVVLLRIGDEALDIAFQSTQGGVFQSIKLALYSLSDTHCPNDVGGEPRTDLDSFEGDR